MSTENAAIQRRCCVWFFRMGKENISSKDKYTRYRALNDEDISSLEVM